MSKHVIRLFGVLLVFAVLAPEAAARSMAALEAFNRGVQQFNNAQYAEAIPYFDKAIDHDSEFPEAYYARAICKRATQDAQGALSDLNSAIHVKSDYVDAYALRGVIWYEQEQWDPALQDFNYVLKHNPNDSQALLGRGIISLKQDNLDQAVRDFRRFVKLKPDDPVTPKLRKLLAELSKEAPPEPPASAAASNPDQPTGSRPMSAASQRLIKELFMSSHALSESSGQGVLRGQRTQTVGDIQQAPSVQGRENKP